MSTATTASGAAAYPPEEEIPFGAKLRQLAEQRGEDTALTVVARDGTAQSMTFAELDGRANQWGRALAAAGAQFGSLVALGIPNSEQLVLAALGCWKIGAVPVPMRWDLPDWERSRVLEVIAPAVTVDDETRSALTGKCRRPVRRPAAGRGVPQGQRDMQQRIYRPAQSDSDAGAGHVDARVVVPVPGRVGSHSHAADHLGARPDVSHQRVLAADIPAGR